MITFIVGLPGSGKTYLAKTLEGGIIDDFSRTFALDPSCVNVKGDLIITDPQACIADKEKIISKLNEWFDDEIQFIAFENDPDQCIRNIQNRDKRVISDHFIRHMSKRYDPYSFTNHVIPVFKPTAENG